MKYLSYLGTALLLISFSCKQPQAQTSPSNIVFDTLQGRPLQIYLPEDHSTEEIYPVIYAHDGQNLFLDSTSYAGAWGFDEVMDSLIATNALPPMIVVGIYNSPQRAEEYVPYNDETILEMMNMDHWDGSMHMLFADFITFDLFPYIEATYGASTRKEDRAILGSSFGAVQAFWMGLTYSEYFGMIGVMSPSVWVDHGAMIREVHSYDQLPDIKMWIDIGSAEYDPRCSELVQNLHQRGLAYGKKLWYYEAPGGRHHESSWRNRLAYPLLIFKGNQIRHIEKTSASNFTALKPNSSSKDTVYVKANLNLTYDNGVKFTAMHLADYSSMDLTVDTVGHVLSPTPGSISIRYKNATFDLVFP